MCDTKILCRKHLLGEHLELHMFVGTIVKGKKVNGYLKNNLLEPLMIWRRHRDLVWEMRHRGYRHLSDFDIEELNNGLARIPTESRSVVINRGQALNDLLSRCLDCRERYENQSK